MTYLIENPKTGFLMTWLICEKEEIYTQEYNVPWSNIHSCRVAVTKIDTVRVHDLRVISHEVHVCLPAYHKNQLLSTVKNKYFRELFIFVIFAEKMFLRKLITAKI